MAKQKRIRLNPQRARLVKAMAAGKSVAEASRIAGYAHPNAAHNALRALKARFSDVMEKHGLTDDTLVTKYLLPLLNAKETRFFAHQGIVLDKRDVPDNGTRTSALDMAFRLKGSYPKNGDDVRAEANVEVKMVLERIRGGS